MTSSKRPSGPGVEAERVVPYQELADSSSNASSGKGEQVEQMFDSIAQHYDLLNRLLSLNIDVRWRRRMVSLLPHQTALHVLDMATGTADVAIEIVRQRPDARVTGIDLSQQMLRKGHDKLVDEGLEFTVDLRQGKAEAIAFPDNTFDAATVSFGVRNFEDIHQGLRELCRVIRPGGRLIVLEFSRMRTFPLAQAFDLYFGRILPVIGSLGSRDSRAYRYLYESVQAFPDGKEFGKLLVNAGFVQPNWQALTFGICTVYTASVPSSSSSS